MSGLITEEIEKRMVLEGTTCEQQWDMIKGYDVVGDHVLDSKYVDWYIGSPKNGLALHHRGVYKYGTDLVQVNPPWRIVRAFSPRHEKRDSHPELSELNKPIFVSVYSSLFGKEAIYQDVRNNKILFRESPEVVIKKIDDAIKQVIPKVQSSTKSSSCKKAD